jgi:hypothetical protein
MANEDVIKRKGVSFTLRDGKEYTVLPLPIDDLIEIWPLVVKLENKEANVDVKLLKDIKKLVYIALKNSNEIEEAKVGKLVDLADLQDIIKVIVGQKKTADVKS